ADPGAAPPVVRLALIQRQLGQAEACLDSVRWALALTHGAARAEVAFLGARLALPRVTAQGGAPVPDPQAWTSAQELLTECLRERPDHPQALWLQAAARSVLGDRPALAAQAGALNRPDFP